jgi:hypothetical protein
LFLSDLGGWLIICRRIFDVIDPFGRTPDVTHRCSDDSPSNGWSKAQILFRGIPNGEVPKDFDNRIRVMSVVVSVQTTYPLFLPVRSYDAAPMTVTPQSPEYLWKNSSIFVRIAAFVSGLPMFLVETVVGISKLPMASQYANFPPLSICRFCLGVDSMY